MEFYTAPARSNKQIYCSYGLFMEIKKTQIWFLTQFPYVFTHEAVMAWSVGEGQGNRKS